MAEAWKPVKGWEGLYEVSDHGQVRSVDREITRRDGAVIFRKGQILSSEVARNGYPSVNLCRDGTQKLTRVHRLVADAFVPNPSNKPFVNHIDGDKTNNRPSNLEWTTSAENRLHAHRVLHVPGPKRKLSNSQVRAIRQSNECQHTIARRYGVTQMTVSKIRRGITYKEVV